MQARRQPRVFTSLGRVWQTTVMFEPIPSFSLNRRARQVAQVLRMSAVEPIVGNPRHIAFLFWAYIAQAAAGSLIGFTAPFLYYFGLL
jgi:hypothetical protein